MGDHILLGESTDANPAPLFVDVETLLATRLLIQSGSGGGKSWLLRRLLEQVYPKCPFIVIDPEGEFATLRERFDVLLVGKGGDTPASVKSAPLLARRVLEAGVSTVCDLFEMLPADRHRWVQEFLLALIDSPKNLWRPFLIVIDEAHIFNPEKGAGESCASDAVVSLASRGRKRGFGAVLATQRLGKLRKDTAAELQNVLIGRTVLDLDRDRAADALGIARKDRPDFSRQVRGLPAGRFFAMGRAFQPGNEEPVLTQVGKVQTTHPQAGVRTMEPPPPSETVRHLFARFKDLPREAERKEQTESELLNELARLRAQVGQAAPPREIKVEIPIEVPSLDTVRVLQQAHRELAEIIHEASKVMGRLAVTASDLRISASDAAASRAKHRGLIESTAAPTMSEKQWHKINDGLYGSISIPIADVDMMARGGKDTTAVVAVQVQGSEKMVFNGVVFSLGARRILNVLVARGGVVTTVQLGVLCGMKHNGTTLGTYVSRLLASRLIERVGPKELQATAAGRELVGTPLPLPSARELIAEWKRHDRLTGKAKDILEMVALEKELTIAEIADRLSIERKGTTLGTYVSRLLSFAVVSRGRHSLKIHPELAL